MAISYNDWKSQYEALDSAGKQKYADLAKNSALGQQYMNQYNAEKNTPTIGGQPIKTTQVAKNTTPTIGGQTIKQQTPTTNNPTIGGKPLLQNGTRPVGDSILGNSNIREVDVKQNGTKPVGDSILGANNIKPVDINTKTSNGYRSILDKPENPVKDFKVLGINPYGTQTAQNGNNTTNRTSVSTPKKNTQTNQGYVTPKQAEWDYQDNSQARMDQIARNLDGFKQTNPELFKDYDTFYNFFIKDKGRSQDQIDYLNGAYANYKATQGYSNMTPQELGNGIANGQIPENAISDIAAIDPNKAEEVKGALNDAQDGIANTGYLRSMSSTQQWGEFEGVWMDKDNNGVDDRRENYPTQEERDVYDARLSDVTRLMEIHNAKRDLIDDVIEQYPDIDYSTAMLIASDRGTKLDKEADRLNISIAQYNGVLDYLQKEREIKNKAGADSIQQLQDNLKMYYQYSPQGMKEYAEAQFNANNISLADADNGTDTDKQRALDQVLDGYYEKYGSIIQRPKAQVINDIMNEVKSTGKTLEQALNDNFVTPLRSKPQFATLSAGGTLGGNDSWSLEAIKDSEGNIVGYVKINKATGAIEGLDGTIGGVGTVGGYDGTNNAGFTNYTPVSDYDRVSTLKKFFNSYVDSTGTLVGKGGQCGSFVNDYLQELGIGRLYTDPIDKKVAITNSDTPVMGAVAVMNSKSYPQYGHVAIVMNVDKNTGKLTLLESNWGGDEKVHIRENVNPSKVIGYFNPSLSANNVKQFGYGENPMTEQIQSMRKSSNLNAEQKKDLSFASKAYNIMYDLASNGGIDHLLKSSDGQKFLANLSNASFIQNGEDATGPQVFEAMKNKVSDQKNLDTVNKLINVIEQKLRKTSGAAIAASEWISNFQMLLPRVGESYNTSKNKYKTFEQTYLMDYFNDAGSGVKGYKYVPLFAEDSPYYKYESSSKGTTIPQNTKGTWNIYTTPTTSNQYDSLYYEMGI